MKKSNVLRVIAIALVAALGIGGAFAYYSAKTEAKNNTFSIAAGQKEEQLNKEDVIIEANWVPENAQDLQPNETVAKDPKVKNVTGYDAWVFLTVEVPAITAQKDGDVEDKVYDAVDITFNDTDHSGQWKLIKSTKSAAAGIDSVYVYGYQAVVTPESETTTLFDNFTVPDFTKLEVEVNDQIDVSAQLIQSEGYDSIDAAAQALGLTS